MADRIQIRPVDLYATQGYRKAGVVLIGDAFATSGPAAGTGARKALNDAERLINVHIPHWLATTGMGADKIAERRVELDGAALGEIRGHFARGSRREARNRVAMRLPHRQTGAAASRAAIS